MYATVGVRIAGAHEANPGRASFRGQVEVTPKMPRYNQYLRRAALNRPSSCTIATTGIASCSVAASSSANSTPPNALSSSANPSMMPWNSVVWSPTGCKLKATSATLSSASSYMRIRPATLLRTLAPQSRASSIGDVSRLARW